MKITGTKSTDIDIDVKDRAHALSGMSYVQASLLEGHELKRHATGAYFHGVPIDPVTQLCALPSGKKSGDVSSLYGLFKMDVLPNYAYERIETPEHMDKLLTMPVDWSLFLREDVVSKLQQIGGHFDIIEAYEPKSVMDLACLIAMIRPGKRHLIGEEWDIVRREMWKKDGDGYYYKKSHAVAFATCIVVQLNSMVERGEV